MGRADFVGTWKIRFLRVGTGQSGEDGFIVIGAAANQDYHLNPHSGKPDHQLDVRFPGQKMISFNEKDQDPNDPFYRYERGVLGGVPGALFITSFKLVKVKSNGKKADGDDATWVASSPPVIIDKGKKKARSRGTKATKSRVSKAGAAKSKSK